MLSLPWPTASRCVRTCCVQNVHPTNSSAEIIVSVTYLALTVCLCTLLSQALTLFSEDDDYFMVVSTCYMRLNRYDEALRTLQQVLDRSPKNYKALYQYAFCQRASGSQRDAIEGLTKVQFIIVVVPLCCDDICI